MKINTDDIINRVTVILKKDPKPTMGATVADYWVGKDAVLLKYEGDGWYTVLCEGKELLVNEHEFRKQ